MKIGQPPNSPIQKKFKFFLLLGHFGELSSHPILLYKKNSGFFGAQTLKRIG
jgi:hypothetical protein